MNLLFADGAFASSLGPIQTWPWPRPNRVAACVRVDPIPCFVGCQELRLWTWLCCERVQLHGLGCDACWPILLLQWSLPP